MSLKNKMITTTRKMILAIIVCLVLVSGSLYEFQLRLRNVLEEQMYDSLNQVAEVQKSNFQSRIEGQLYVLNSVSDYISKVSEGDEEMIKAIMESTVRAGDFINIAIFRTNGIGYNHLGESESIVDHRCFAGAMKGKATVTRGTLSNGTEAMAISVPIYRMGNIEGVLKGTIKLSSIKNTLMTSGFGGDGYVFIVDSDGNVILDSRDATQTTHKYLSDLYAGTSLPEGVSPEIMIQNMKNNKEGTLHYDVNGSQRYATYKKIGINDWYLYSLVNQKQVASQSEEIMSIVYIFIMQIVLGIGFLVILLIFGNKRRVEQLKDSHKDVLATQKLLDGVYRDMPGGMIVGTVEKCPKLRFVSMGTLDIFGYTEQEFSEKFGNNVRNIIYDEDREECSAETDRQMDEGTDVSLHHRIITKSGEVRWVHNSGKIVAGDAGERLYYCVIIDITNYKLAEIELNIRAKCDSMTGLYNKMVTQEKIMESIKMSDENTNQAMFAIDLDDFKAINDNYGHLTGDTVLNQLAIGLQSMFRRSDIIGRIGGDEFVVFLPYFYNKEDILKKADEICKMFVESDVEELENFHASVSIGVAFTDGEKLSYEELFRRADSALYEAKQNGKNRYVVYKNKVEIEDQLTLIQQ